MSRSLLIALLVAGCSGSPVPAEPSAYEDSVATPAPSALGPALVLPSTRLQVVGTGFSAPAQATVQLRLRGRFDGDNGRHGDVALALPATYVDEQHLTAQADATMRAALPAPSGRFTGTLVVAATGALDGDTRTSAPLQVTFAVAERLQPTLTAASDAASVNDAVVLRGDGFLLGGGEGETHVVVDGCFVAAGVTAAGASDGAAACAGVPVRGVELTAHPLASAPWDRTQASFAFAPGIAGVRPGRFTGSVRVRNVLADGSALDGSGTPSLAATLGPPRLTSLAPLTVSLGQYLDLAGAGFVGDSDDDVTLVRLSGQFAPANGTPFAVNVTVVPSFVDGQTLRYVIDEADALGRIIDLRHVDGHFDGRATPIVRHAGAEIMGAAASVSLTLAPVKQVVYVRFLPSFVSSLGLWGLGAADAAVRARVLEVAARDYRGVNVELRTAPPEDFALYATVDVAGPDPNDLGLFGYDNTPGKDVGNLRLFDSIGGVNAEVQADGFPGYGGIFSETFLGYSAHPPKRVRPIYNGNGNFDTIFDAVRPDTGHPVSAAEARAVVPLADSTSCLAGNRSRGNAVSCAVYVLGNLVGSTLSHELGHSLGLANPDGGDFHDYNDAPNRLMDAGGARPFEERAELAGAGPSVFCAAEYVYLQKILPGAPDARADAVLRPGCN